jgi:hypothetical protein
MHPWPVYLAVRQCVRIKSLVTTTLSHCSIFGSARIVVIQCPVRASAVSFAVLELLATLTHSPVNVPLRYFCKSVTRPPTILTFAVLVALYGHENYLFVSEAPDPTVNSPLSVVCASARSRPRRTTDIPASPGLAFPATLKTMR